MPSHRHRVSDLHLTTNGIAPAGKHTVTSEFLARDNLVILALPWLPLASATPVWRGCGLLSLAIVGGWLLLCWRRRGYSDGRAGAVALIGLLAVGLAVTRFLSLQTVVQVIQLVLVALAIRVGPLLSFTPVAARGCVFSCVGLSLLALADTWNGGSWLFENANSYGLAGFCWGAVLLKVLLVPEKRIRIFRFLVCIGFPFLLAVVSNSRAAIAAFVIMLVWPPVSLLFRSPLLRVTLPLLVPLVPLGLVFLVVTGRLGNVQDLIPIVGEKSPLSGRDVIWLDVIGEVSANGYKGFGLGSEPGGVLTSVYQGLSAHNGFLQVLYQFGGLGLAIFLVGCGLVLAKSALRSDRGVSAAIFLGALLHEVFEVVLTQNLFGAGLLLWLVVTIRMNGSSARSAIAT